MRARDDVIISYSGMPHDTMLSGQTCPQCNGGTHHERSLSVGRSGGWLWWRCHRATCVFRGKHRVSGVGEYAEDTNEKKERYADFRRSRMPSALKAELSKKYSLSPETIDVARWSYTPNYVTHSPRGIAEHGPRVIFPLFDPNGGIRGEQFRSYEGREPKAFTNVNISEEAVCWYKFRKYGRILVVVEDIPSALRVAQANVDALALLGTVVNLNRILEIAGQEYNRVWLTLDRDALGVAITYMGEYGPYLPAMRVKALEDKDIKDMSAEEFDLFIAEVLV